MELNPAVPGNERTTPRPRSVLVIAVVVTIALGLASRFFPGMFPSFLGKYPGDALWAIMVYWLMAILWPSASVMRLSAGALIFAGLDEFSQLYQAPWINQIRATTLGHLILGRRFGWLDLTAYVAGITIVAVSETLITGRSRTR